MRWPGASRELENVPRARLLDQSGAWPEQSRTDPVAGTFPTITMTTTGAPQVGTLDPYARQEAETIAWETGVETEPSSEGGMNVGWIENGDWIKVKGVAFGAGAASFDARVASAASCT